MDTLDLIARELHGQYGMAIGFDACLAVVLVLLVIRGVASHFGTSRWWHAALVLIGLAALTDLLILSLISPFWVMGVEVAIAIAWLGFWKASCEAWLETYGGGGW